MITEQVILLAEDNDDDAELTIMAFTQAKIANPVIRVRDGVEALDWLFRRGEHAARAPEIVPAMVLLDLKMPRLNGIEVLAEIRKDVRIRHLPVIILTSSAEEHDRISAYEGHANSYVQKPIDYDAFVTVARQIGVYWMLLNLPAPSHNS